jgi:hypothetical protein
MTRTRSFVALGLAIATVLGTTVAADAQHRPPRPGDRRPRPPHAEAALVLEARALDGSGNNLAHPDWGSVDTLYRRVGDAVYADGLGAMVAGPDPRYISNRIFNDTTQNVFSSRGLTQWVWTWGQLLDHTFGLRESGAEDAALAFDAGDPLESFPNDFGMIPFTRTAPAAGTGDDDARQQVNTVSSFIDAWAVYGGTSDRLAWLRDGAELRLPDGFLPRADSLGDAASAPTMELMGSLQGDPSSAVVAGDQRANENVALTAAHTLLAREHNRIVGLLPSTLSDDERFEIARRVVGAEMQWITYTQFLPAVGVTLPPYRGYRTDVDPSLSNEFATVGYRAHSMVHGEIEVEVGDEDVAIPLNDTFGNPNLLRLLGVDAVAEGLAQERQYANDEQIDNELRSVMFQVPGPQTGVLDLAALDIQRGRDHGMPGYNAMRVAYGLAPKASFTAITGESTETLPAGTTIDDPVILDIVSRFDDEGRPVAAGTEAATEDVVRVVRRSTVAARLKAIYGSVDAVDAFVGMSAERHVPGTEMGELELAMWREQFTRLRDGDRFFYGNDPVLREIEHRYGVGFRVSLARLITANTDVEPDELRPNVFRLGEPPRPRHDRV